MKNYRRQSIRLLITLCFLSSAFIGAARAQSTDIDNPTILTSPVVEGEGDGSAETFYYKFTALKGDVKVTLDAKTDYYSVIMDAALTTEDGKELLKISAVANDTGKREVATKHFVHETDVILRVRLPKDEHLKLLTYKIKLDGAVKVQPDIASSTDDVPVRVLPTTLGEEPGAEASATALPSNPSTKAKIKAKAKKEGKKALDKFLDN
jgi:hypothetical protein